MSQGTSCFYEVWELVCYGVPQNRALQAIVAGNASTDRGLEAMPG